MLPGLQPLLLNRDSAQPSGESIEVMSGLSVYYLLLIFQAVDGSWDFTAKTYKSA